MLYELWSLLSVEPREWIMAIGELETTGKEEVVSISRYSADIHLEGPRKAMRYEPGYFTSRPRLLSGTSGIQARRVTALSIRSLAAAAHRQRRSALFIFWHSASILRLKVGIASTQLGPLHVADISQ